MVAIHGCTWTSWRRRTQLRHVIRAVRETIPDVDILTPELPIEFWSLERPERIVADIVAVIDDAWRSRQTLGGDYTRILMVGFSFGSVFVRSVYAAAAGARGDATVDAASVKPWAKHVSRIVLLAGLNRGWTVDSPVTRLRSLMSNLGTAIGHLLPRKPTLFSIRRGAPFLTLTRLQWMALKRTTEPPPLTVQLLGTQDDLVSPADKVDLATGGDFVYIEVPRSGHFNVIDMSRRTPEGAGRRSCFILALAGGSADLARSRVDPADLAKLLPFDALGGEDAIHPANRQAQLDDLVFVVHGIRDKGFWTRKIARAVAARSSALSLNVAAVTPTYGYFAMLPFLCPWTRRGKVEWLLDLYVTARASYPDARISFIGHSNGTYMLSGALAACPAVRFERVVFAGSVVRSNFDWSHYSASNQVGRVLNYVATSDLVVAVFPRLFQTLRLQDLGGAGHDGFTATSPLVTDIEYVRGRHSAALDEQHWPGIAEFVLGGNPPDRLQVEGRRSSLVVFAAHAAIVIWSVLLLFAIAPTYLALTALGFPKLPGVDWLTSWQSFATTWLPAWAWALVLMGYVRLASGILTRL